MKALVALMLMASSAHASCAPKAQIEAALVGKYGESPTHNGMTTVLGLTNLIEVWVSPGGSFTILQTNSAAMSCIIASGTDWGGVVHAPRGEEG